MIVNNEYVTKTGLRRAYVVNIKGSEPDYEYGYGAYDEGYDNFYIRFVYTDGEVVNIMFDGQDERNYGYDSLLEKLDA